MTILYILIAILMFGLLIAIHEFGHFATAKLSGVRVNEFAIGMGPKLWSHQGTETLYTLRLLPIGGYCAMEGEDVDTDDPRSFQKASSWKKLLVLISGAAMNFLLGLLIYLLLFSGAKQYYSTTIGAFEDGFTAQGEQGLMVGDRILSIDGHPVYLFQDVSIYFGRGGEALDLTVERNGAKVKLGKVRMPWMQSTDDAGNPLYYEDGSPVLIRGIIPAVKTATVADRLRLTWYNAIDNVRLVWMSLGDLVSGHVGIRDFSGAIQITALMGEAGEQGAQAAEAAGKSPFLGAMTNILNLVAFITINLAVMNLLPIPALDGGRVLFLLVNVVFTALTKKRLDPKYEGAVNTVGFLLLVGLMVAVMASDILKLFGR